MAEKVTFLNWKSVFLIIISVSLIVFLAIWFAYDKLKPLFDELENPVGNVLGDSVPVPSLSSSPVPTSTILPTTTHNIGPSLSSNPKLSPSPLASVSPSPTSFTFLLPSQESFEKDITHWQMTGDVTLIDESTENLYKHEAFHGQKVVRIGRETNEGFPLSQNTLSTLIPTNTKKITFRYRLFSYDYKGFDNPAFLVKVNEKEVFRKSAMEIDSDEAHTKVEKLDGTAWLSGEVTFDEPIITTTNLTFLAGNDEVNLSASQPHQSWVYIDLVEFE